MPVFMYQKCLMIFLHWNFFLGSSLLRASLIFLDGIDSNIFVAVSMLLLRVKKRLFSFLANIVSRFFEYLWSLNPIDSKKSFRLRLSSLSDEVVWRSIIFSSK